MMNIFRSYEALFLILLMHTMSGGTALDRCTYVALNLIINDANFIGRFNSSNVHTIQQTNKSPAKIFLNHFWYNIWWMGMA